MEKIDYVERMRYSSDPKLWYYDDIEGNQIKGQQAIMPKATIRRGEVISVDWGPHPWGWLPAPIV